MKKTLAALTAVFALGTTAAMADEMPMQGVCNNGTEEITFGFSSGLADTQDQQDQPAQLYMTEEVFVKFAPPLYFFGVNEDDDGYQAALYYAAGPESTLIAYDVAVKREDGRVIMQILDRAAIDAIVSSLGKENPLVTNLNGEQAAEWNCELKPSF